MRISATGSSAGGNGRGFTLLEMMLVLLLMAMASLWVVPDFFAARNADVSKEGRQLVSLLRLSAEEAQLTGRVIRCTLDRNGYQFSRRQEDGAWLPIQQAPFLPHRLSRYAIQAELSGVVSGDLTSRREAHSVQLLFYPDGALTMADILFGDDSEQLHIRLRPGPGGIGLAS